MACAALCCIAGVAVGELSSFCICRMACTASDFIAGVAVGELTIFCSCTMACAASAFVIGVAVGDVTLPPNDCVVVIADFDPDVDVDGCVPISDLTIDAVLGADGVDDSDGCIWFS